MTSCRLCGAFLNTGVNVTCGACAQGQYNELNAAYADAHAVRGELKKAEADRDRLAKRVEVLEAALKEASWSRPVSTRTVSRISFGEVKPARKRAKGRRK